MAEMVFNRIAEERDLDVRALSAGTGPARPNRDEHPRGWRGARYHRLLGIE